MNERPSTGSMVHWRFKERAPCPWNFGYVTYESGHDLIRMGLWNGDKHRGPVVSAAEIEWKPYKN